MGYDKRLRPVLLKGHFGLQVVDLFQLRPQILQHVERLPAPGARAADENDRSVGRHGPAEVTRQGRRQLVPQRVGIQMLPRGVQGELQRIAHRGVELAATKTLSNLTSEFWGGFGATASYSYTESETSVGGGSFYGQDLPLPGLSENVWSATVFWDYRGWTANVNTRYRDDFIQNLPIPGAGSPTLAQPWTTVDAQFSYAFESGWMLVVSGDNLTDEENIIEYGVNGTLGEWKQFGRQFYVGFNWVY